jgi:hypothetical protein
MAGAIVSLAACSNGNKVIGLESEQYSNISDIRAPDMVNWARRNVPDATGTTASLLGGQSTFTMTHMRGQIYLESGRTYVFKEVVDDSAYLLIDGKEVLSDETHNRHTTGIFTTGVSDNYDFDFYVYNNIGGGGFNLQISTDGGATFRDLPAKIQTSN